MQCENAVIYILDRNIRWPRLVPPKFCLANSRRPTRPHSRRSRELYRAVSIGSLYSSSIVYRPEVCLYILDLGTFVTHDRVNMAFNCVWSLLGFVLPVVTLIYCNVHLVAALRESRRMRRIYVVNSRVPTSCGSRPTECLHSSAVGAARCAAASRGHAAIEIVFALVCCGRCALTARG